MHRCVVFCLSKRNDACNIVSVSWVITLHVHTRPPARARSHIKLCTLFTVFMVLADVYIRELQCSNIGRDDDDNGLDFSLKCCCFSLFLFDFRLILAFDLFFYSLLMSAYLSLMPPDTMLSACRRLQSEACLQATRVDDTGVMFINTRDASPYFIWN